MNIINLRKTVCHGTHDCKEIIHPMTLFFKFWMCVHKTCAVIEAISFDSAEVLIHWPKNHMIVTFFYD